MSTLRPSVLLVDDEQSILDRALVLLEQRGYEMLVARDLDRMLEVLERRTPEAVLLDMMMPEILGSDLVGYVREGHDICGPVLLFSNIEEGRLQSYVRSSRADGFIPKDPDLRLLAERLPLFLPLPSLT